MNITLKLYESKEEECKIKREYLNSTSLLDLLEFNCIMLIKINDMVYFEEGICPLEMRHVICNWEQSFNGVYNDFIYNTEDDSLNAKNALDELKWLKAFAKKQLIKKDVFMILNLWLGKEIDCKHIKTECIDINSWELTEDKSFEFSYRKVYQFIDNSK